LRAEGPVQSEALEERLERLARQTGLTQTALARAAIREHLGDPDAVKDLRRLDRPVQQRLLGFLRLSVRVRLPARSGRGLQDTPVPQQSEADAVLMRPSSGTRADGFTGSEPAQSISAPSVSWNG
jgi:hypothetical protein